MAHPRRWALWGVPWPVGRFSGPVGGPPAALAAFLFFGRLAELSNLRRSCQQSTECASCASTQGPGRRSDAIGSAGVSASIPSLRTTSTAVPRAPSSAVARTSARRAATCSPLRTRRTDSRHPISWVRIGAQYDDRPAPAAHDRRSCCSIPSLSPRRQMLQLCPDERFLRHGGRGHAQFRRRWTRQERR